jgi:hypothetical protein
VGKLISNQGAVRGEAALDDKNGVAARISYVLDQLQPEFAKRNFRMLTITETKKFALLPSAIQNSNIECRSFAELIKFLWALDEPEERSVKRGLKGRPEIPLEGGNSMDQLMKIFSGDITRDINKIQDANSLERSIIIYKYLQSLGLESYVAFGKGTAIG